MTLLHRQIGPRMTDIRRLPGPQVEKWEWQLLGSCRGEDTELFFHPEGERGPARRNRDAAAVAVCSACPVVQACRSHALAVDPHAPLRVIAGDPVRPEEVIDLWTFERDVRSTDPNWLLAETATPE